MAGNTVHIIPIGGIEEVGKNMTLYEYRDQILIVDAGIRFPDAETPGVDFILNDISYLKTNADRVVGLVFTHGHLDHIGALPWLLKEINPVLYATPFTRALINKMLAEKSDLKPKLKEYKPGKAFDLGHFHIDTIQVNHSIPDAVSLAITTPVGTIIHTGDFKIDHTPVGENVIDLAKFAAYGNQGVLCLLSDSTNAHKEGSSLSESIVKENLENIFLKSKSRLVIATFASQIGRIRAIVQLAKATGKKIAVSGRSMINNLELALGLDFIKGVEDIFVDPARLKKLRKDQTIILTTGTQGEPQSALTLMAEGRHKIFKLEKDDLVIMSSSAIPGNERGFMRLMNLLAKKEIETITNKELQVHSSGHAAAEELKSLLTIVKPRYFVPIHGAPVQLFAHKKIAIKAGVPEANIFIMENGLRLEVSKKAARTLDKIKLRETYVEGSHLSRVNKEILQERTVMEGSGSVSVAIHMPAGARAEVHVLSKGFIHRTEDPLMNEAKEIIHGMLKGRIVRGEDERKELELKIKKTLRTLFFTSRGRNPAIFMHFYTGSYSQE